MQDLKQAYKESMNCEGYENKKTDTEYRLEINKETKTVIVSFQGSRSVLDWVYNFAFWKKPYKHMKKLFFVHAGLFNKYKSVQDDIMDKIIPVLKPDWKVRGYGFSQGAALITYFHEDIKYRLPKIDLETYALAPPKGFTFFNAKFLQTVRFKTLYTVKDISDIVPHLPFWFMGFRHYGNIIKLGKCKIVFPWNWKKEHMGYEKLF